MVDSSIALVAGPLTPVRRSFTVAPGQPAAQVKPCGGPDRSDSQADSPGIRLSVQNGPGPGLHETARQEPVLLTDLLTRPSETREMPLQTGDESHRPSLISETQSRSADS